MTDHPMTPGTRVRHYGQQWPHALHAGTGDIVAAKGPWPNGSYEYLVRTAEDSSRRTSGDNPETAETWWASHATIPVTPTA